MTPPGQVGALAGTTSEGGAPPARLAFCLYYHGPSMFRCPGGWDRAAPAASRNAGVGRVQSARSVILVVEDDAAVRESLHELLARAGHAVICATDGRTALDRVAAGGVDLVLLDLLLPGMDGIALCRELRARPAEAGYLPIIMLTALSSEAERHAGFAAGADDYVTKPFEPAHLLDRVAVWLRTRARLEAAQARLRDERATSARLAEERAAALAAMRAAHERLLAGQAQEERLLREAEARTRTFRVLHELAVAIGGVLDPEALAQLTTDRARDLLGVDSVSLWWWDAEAALLRRLAGHVPYPERAPQASPSRSARPRSWTTIRSGRTPRRRAPAAGCRPPPLCRSWSASARSARSAPTRSPHAGSVARTCSCSRCSPRRWGRRSRQRGCTSSRSGGAPRSRPRRRSCAGWPRSPPRSPPRPTCGRCSSCWCRPRQMPSAWSRTPCCCSTPSGARWRTRPPWGCPPHTRRSSTVWRSVPRLAPAAS